MNRRTDWPGWAMIAVAALGLLLHSCQPVARGAEPATQPTTQPAECFDLKSDDAGRLVFTPLLPCDISLGGGRWWTCGEDGTLDFGNFRPGGCWCDRVRVRACGEWIELSGRALPIEWRVFKFTLTQTPTESRAEYTIRTPVGQPDVTVRRSERLTALLLLRNPELRPMLNEVLAGIGCEPYDPGPFVRDQLAGTLAVTPEVAERARVLIDLSDSPCWRNRAKAECALEAMGIDGAKALLLLDRRGLPPQTQLTIDRVLSRWPIIERR